MTAGPPIVIVHELAHCRAALEAAARTGLAVALWSAEAAAASLGLDYAAEMMAAAQAEFPGAPAGVTAGIDCGPFPGLAVAALRLGWRHVGLRPEVPAWERVAAIARAQGAALYAEPPRGLDLLHCPTPLPTCLKWLADTARSGGSGG